MALNGNPNVKSQPFQPTRPELSRYAPGRTNPYGMGIERLQGNVPQGPKRNWGPSLSLPKPHPLIQAEIDRRRQPIQQTQQRQIPAARLMEF